MRWRLIQIGTKVAGIFLFGLTANAQLVQDSVAELQGIDVIEHLGDTIPLGLRFTDDQGDQVTLGDYFNEDVPVVLILGYYECPMLCNLVFNGITEAVRDLGWTPGEKFRIVTVSIKPAETSELAAAKKKNYIESLGMPGAGQGWAFLVGAGDQSRTLADAIGFQYYYVEERDEYAHPTVITLLTPDGVISRYLYGISFPGRDLKLGLLEASEGKIGSTLDRIILYCYHYDPDAAGYVIFAGNVMKIAGLLTVVLLALFLGGLWVRERRRRRRETVYVSRPYRENR